MANWPPPYMLQGAPSISSAVGAQSAASVLAGGDHQPSSSVTSPSARCSRAPSVGPAPAPSLSSHAPANSSASAGSIEASAASTIRPPSAKRKRKEAAPKPEKRLARYVSSPNMKVLERMQRAFTHRLYLIERVGPDGNEARVDYRVLGATGNVYTVTLARQPSCTCPDAAKGNTVCKHWLFVVLRVLKLPRDDPRVWQKALLSTELADLLDKDKAACEETAAAGVVASDVVRRRYHEVVGTSEGAKEHAEELLGSMQRPVEGDCPICFEELSPEGRPGEPVVFCHTCGNNIHRDCFAHWSQSRPKGQVTCVYCRSKWAAEGGLPADGGAPVGEGGYVNLAAFSNDHQDVSMESLYPATYEWIGRPRGGRRSWGYR